MKTHYQVKLYEKIFRRLNDPLRKVELPLVFKFSHRTTDMRLLTLRLSRFVSMQTCSSGLNSYVRTFCRKRSWL